MPAVSIVLPAYNAEAAIRAAIDSIRDQTFSDWELLIVDDGSADETRAIAQSAARADSRIRVLERAHGGIVAALNAGIAAAHAPLIARIDADDEALPERLAEQTKWIATAKVGLVSCLVEYGGDRIANAGYALHVDWVNGLVTAEDIEMNRFIESPLAHPTVMFRRELIDQFGGYRDGPFPEDYELWLRWLDAGVRMVKVPRMLLRWNDPPTRLSRADPRYSPENFFRIKATYIARELARVRRGREVWIWGAGRPTRKRAAHLTEGGVTISGYIDVDKKKIGGTVAGRPVIGPADLPPPDEAVVLSYVGSRGARDLIRAALLSRGFREPTDCLMCA